MPVWQSIYEELKDKNFEIISAAQDTGGEAAAGKIFEDANVTYASIIDVDHAISSLYNLVNVPSAVWVDEEGRIVRINEGTLPPMVVTMSPSGSHAIHEIQSFDQSTICWGGALPSTGTFSSRLSVGSSPARAMNASQRPSGEKRLLPKTPTEP